MIGLSGGIKGSHLIFVLGLIPPMVGYVRGGGRTMTSASIGIVVIICLEMFGERYGHTEVMPSFWCSTLIQLTFGLKPSDASQSIDFPIACGVGLLGGIFLSLIQSHLSISGAIPDQIVSKSYSLLRKTIRDPAKLDTLVACVQQAFKKVGRIVSLTNVPELHCSEVHPLRDVVFQALVLALPGVKINNPTATRRVAEMVFAIHWLDDMFDHLGYAALATDNGTSIDISTIKMNQISNFYHPYGISRIVRLIKGNLLWSYERAKWQDGIDSGLLRVVLAGFIHSGNRMMVESTKRLKSEIKKIVTDENLLKKLETANTAFCWGVSKTDMPLVLGMYWNPKKIPDIGNRSLILDSLFMPLLVWHNLSEEIRREKLPRDGFDKKNNIKLRQEIANAVRLCLSIIKDKEDEILSWAEMWPSMKEVLKLVNDLYSPALPQEPIYNEYQQYIRKLVP
jgi:hypothetical protein